MCNYYIKKTVVMINNYKILYAVGKSKTKFVGVLEFVLILLLTENIVKKLFTLLLTLLLVVVVPLLLLALVFFYVPLVLTIFTRSVLLFIGRVNFIQLFCFHNVYTL